MKQARRPRELRENILPACVQRTVDGGEKEDGVEDDDSSDFDLSYIDFNGTPSRSLRELSQFSR